MRVTTDPRIEHTRRVVLDAAIEVIAGHGFAGATIDAIASRSGVARSTIYRNWPGRVDLLLDAVRSRFGTLREQIEGDARRDLLALCRRLADLLTREPMASVAAALILESRHDPSLRELHRRFTETRLREIAEVVAAAQARGELSRVPDAATVAADLGAAIFFRALVLRVPIEAGWVEAHVESVLVRYRGA